MTRRDEGRLIGEFRRDVPEDEEGDRECREDVRGEGIEDDEDGCEGVCQGWESDECARPLDRREDGLMTRREEREVCEQCESRELNKVGTRVRRGRREFAIEESFDRGGRSESLSDVLHVTLRVEDLEKAEDDDQVQGKDDLSGRRRDEEEKGEGRREEEEV